MILLTKKKIKNGFTLIELLVVIAIIGLLSSIVFASLNSARKKARDARRIADLRQIQLALNMFYDEYGFYPAERNQASCGGWGNRSSSAATACGGNKWLTSDANFDKYMPIVPVDPINNLWYAEDASYAYTYTGGSSIDYDLRAFLEDSSNPYRCEKKCYKAHVFSAGGDAWCANDPISNPCGGTPFWDNASRAMLYSDH
ncbi:MAG: type II secretion system protein [bacterium]|nr:type II secretion system protein [bacterium]